MASKKDRTRCLVLDLMRQHEADGMLPTSIRFVFYELEQVGNATKPDPSDTRKNRRRSIGWPPGEQDVIDALRDLRGEGVIPWSWIVDETRQLTEWSYAPTVLAYVLDSLEAATINPWGDDEPPLILCESRATAGVLRATVGRYVCPIAGTNGQTAGFLHTDIAPTLGRVLYLGDLDRSGRDIEGNTRRVLERATGRAIDWRRLGMTQPDRRRARHRADMEGRWPRREGRTGDRSRVTRTGGVVDLVRAELDEMLPEPLARVLERTEQQRREVRARLTDS